MLSAAAAQKSTLDERTIAMATGRALLDLLDLLEREQLREAATVAYANFSNPELELYAAVRALEESEAEIEARPAPFPASLPPWLVMQWLPIREVAAALRVAWSWQLDCEHYFRVFAERHRMLLVPLPEFMIKSVHIRWETAAICHVQMQRSGRLSEFQEQVFRYYGASGVRDDRFIPISDAIAAVRLVVNDATAEQVKTAVANLVSLHKLRASTTGNQHRAVFEVGGLDDLSPLQRCVLKYHIVYGTSDEGCHVHDVAAHLGTDLSLVRAAVDFLEGEGYLISTIDEDHYEYSFIQFH